MKINRFRDMYIAELQELVSAENQFSDALLRMAGVAAHPALRDLLLHHRGETEVQGERLATMLRKHGANPMAHTDQAMQALVHETRKMRDEQKMLHRSLDEEREFDVLLTRIAKR